MTVLVAIVGVLALIGGVILGATATVLLSLRDRLRRT